MEAPGRGEVSLPLDVRLDDRNVFAPDILCTPTLLPSFTLALDTVFESDEIAT